MGRHLIIDKKHIEWNRIIPSKKTALWGVVTLVALAAITFVTLSLIHHYTGYQFGKLGTALTASNKWFIGAAHAIAQGVQSSKIAQAILGGVGALLFVGGVCTITYFLQKNAQRNVCIRI